MIAPELFQLNLVRGRGLFARAVMKAQLASPGFTPVFAALVSVVNTKLPENGELILKRVIVAFRRAYKRRDKVVATALAKFIAHMVNQQVGGWVKGEAGGVVECACSGRVDLLLLTGRFIFRLCGAASCSCRVSALRFSAVPVHDGAQHTPPVFSQWCCCFLQDSVVW